MSGNQAQQFYEALKAAGHSVFLAGESIRLRDNWSQRVDEALERRSPSQAAAV